MDKQEFIDQSRRYYHEQLTETGKCVNCGKDLIKRDVEYSRYMFGSDYCASHAPKTNIWDKEFLLKR